MTNRSDGERPSALETQPNFRRGTTPALWPYSAGDDFYEMLMDAHRELTDEQSEALNARLILLLANHVGELDVLAQALALARKGL